MATAYCSYCGRRLDERAYWCPACGLPRPVAVSPLPAAAPPAAAQSPSAAAPPTDLLPSQPLTPAPRKRFWQRPGCLVGMGVTLLALLCWLYAMLQIVVALNPFLLLTAEGHCTMTQSQVQLSTETLTRKSLNGPKTYTVTHYHAQFAYQLTTADGQTVSGSKYNWEDGLLQYPDDQATAQARVKQYQVGQAFLCWYNPAFPAFSALRRDAGGMTFALVTDESKASDPFFAAGLILWYVLTPLLLFVLLCVLLSVVLLLLIKVDPRLRRRYGKTRRMASSSGEQSD